MSAVLPFAGIGTILTGTESKRWLEVWGGSDIVHVTKLPGGRCVVPLEAGTITLRSKGEIVAGAAIDPRLVPGPGATPYEVRGPGTLHVWQFDGDPDHGLLAGGPPMASGEGRLDLATLGLPHDTVVLAVQVRANQRQGPIHLVLYQPSPKPASITIDHDVGALGPRTHLVVDTAGLPRLEVGVTRHIRQTGQTSSGSYEVHAEQAHITFDDLLHGDRLEVRVAPPHALAGPEHPVQTLEYRYHAVPETRLEPDGNGDPVDFKAGVGPVPKGEVLDALQSALGGDLSVPSWYHEWPRLTRGKTVDRLRDALRAAGVDASIEADGSAMLWWLAVVEAGQSVEAARRLRSLRLLTAPPHVDAVARAAKSLDGFPAHIFKEIDAEHVIASRITSFQERLGIADQRGDDIGALAQGARQALQAAADAWAGRIRNAGLQWLDGAVPPLDEGPGLNDLRQLIVKDPAEAIQALRTARQRIWQTARITGTMKITAPDLEARKALLAWHLEQSGGVVARLAQHIEAAGVEAPETEANDVEQLARRLGDILRTADAAIARVGLVPPGGPAFVEGAAREGRRFAKELHDALGVWTGARVPPAIRSPAERLLEALEPDAVARLAVWHHFLQDSHLLVRDVGAMTASPGDVGTRARHVKKLFTEALERRDPASFAKACGDFARIESGLMAARDTWEQVLADASPSTRAALGLGPGLQTPWDGVRRRIELDASEIRTLGNLLEGHAGKDEILMRGALRKGGELDQALDAVANAGPDIERALAVQNYNTLRNRLGGWFGDEDAISALRTAYVAKIAGDVRVELRRRIGRSDDARIAALRAFPDIEGTRELLILAQYLDMAEHTDPASNEAVEDAQRLEQLLEHVAETRDDPWSRIEEAVEVRLRAAYPDLSRYLGDAAPAWETLEQIDVAVQWLHAICTGGRDPITRTDVAAMLPGTRRLVEHTLKERGLWL